MTRAVHRSQNARPPPRTRRHPRVRRRAEEAADCFPRPGAAANPGTGALKRGLGDHAAGHDAVAEQGDQGGQQGGRGQDRDGDDGHRPERHRAQRLVVDHPEAGQRDDHGQAREGDREARRSRAPGRGPSGSRPARALLAVAGEDEERVVDGDADADHRGHVGDEDRGLHLQRDEVDQRAGDDHADEAERERQRGGGERAEDDEQDQGDDREAARPRPCARSSLESSCIPAQIVGWPAR